MKTATVSTQTIRSVTHVTDVPALLPPFFTQSADGFICTITDITTQRQLEQARIAHAEERERFAQERAELAEMRRKEADERRRGQELLIDVTSHELRQPVSAILNCASVLRANLGALHEELQDSQLYGKPYMPTEKLLQSMVEDLEAIDAMYQCGLAQGKLCLGWS